MNQKGDEVDRAKRAIQCYKMWAAVVWRARAAAGAPAEAKVAQGCAMGTDRCGVLAGTGAAMRFATVTPEVG